MSRAKFCVIHVVGLRSTSGFRYENNYFKSIQVNKSLKECKVSLPSIPGLTIARKLGMPVRRSAEHQYKVSLPTEPSRIRTTHFHLA